MGAWQPVTTTDFRKATLKLQPAGLFRVGTDETQILYILPESSSFPSEVEELSSRMTAEQVLLLMKAIKYSDEMVLWPDKGSKPVANPVLSEESLSDDERRFEVFVEILAENNALRKEIHDLEVRIEAILRKNELVNQRCEDIDKNNKRLHVSNMLLQKRSIQIVQE